jgi:hypothetical protein
MSETVSGKSVSSRVKRYGRVPLRLALDPMISDQAKTVFAVIAAHVFQGSVARIGQRFLGDMLGLSAATIGRRIGELEAGGYVKKGEKRNGYRGFYILTSPIFGQKQRSGDVDEVVSSPSGGRRLASVRTA